MTDTAESFYVEFQKPEIVSGLACLAEMRRRILDEQLDDGCTCNPELDPCFVASAHLSLKLWDALSPGSGKTADDFMSGDYLPRVGSASGRDAGHPGWEGAEFAFARVDLRNDGVVTLRVHEDEEFGQAQASSVVRFIEERTAGQFVLISELTHQFRIGTHAYQAFIRCRRLKGVAFVVAPGFDLGIIRSAPTGFEGYFSAHSNLEHAIDWATAVLNISPAVSTGTPASWRGARSISRVERVAGYEPERCL